jgi:DNA-binding winged helix-turn-helix (wHTH) protein
MACLLKNERSALPDTRLVETVVKRGYRIRV